MFLPNFKHYFCCIWQQKLFKVFSKECLFFCYFEKMNDFKYAFGTSSWIKNSGSIANIWTDCNWTGTQNNLVLKRTLNHLAKMATFPFLYTLFSLSTPNTFFHIFAYVYLYWIAIILENASKHPNWKKQRVLKS